MSLQTYTKEQLQEMSLIEIAFELLKERKEALPFKVIMDELTNLLELTDDQVKAKIAQFYTDLNIDGRFLGLGDNTWGLRVWYPIDQVEEEVVTDIKPKKKKKAKKAKKDEDLDLDDFDELDEEDIDYDDIDDLDDEDILDEDDDDLLDDEDDDADLEDDDLLDKDEEFDLGDEDEEIEEDELDIDEDEEEDL